MTWLDENRPWLERAAERWLPRAGAIEPLRVRAWMRSPIYWDGRTPIALDGALQHVVVRRTTGRLPDDVFNWITRDESTVADVPIPIADVEIGGVAIACSSSAWPWPDCAEGTRYRNKRARLDAMGTGKITVSGGPYKSLHIPNAVLFVPILDFFVCGDRALLEELLVDVSGLGRDSGRGLGGVEGWQVDPDPQDRSLVCNGRPMRPLPIVTQGPYHCDGFAPESSEIRSGVLRAPYWRDWMRVPVVAPVIPVGDETSWWADVIRSEAA